jgi:PAS domain S-box-containing protein
MPARKKEARPGKNKKTAPIKETPKTAAAPARRKAPFPVAGIGPSAGGLEARVMLSGHMLEDSRERYFDLFDFAPVGYLTTDLNSKILDANLTVAEMLGIKRGYLIGRLLTGFIAPDDLTTFHLYHKIVLRTMGRRTCDLRLLNKNGNELHCRIETIAVRGEEKTKEITFRSAILDVSGLVEAHNQLKRAHERFLNITENAHDVIVRMDRDLRCIYMNPAIEKYSGVTRAAYQGKTIEETNFDLIPESLKTAYLEVFRSGSAMTVQFDHPSAGGRRTFQAILVPEKNSTGVVETVLSISRDITGLKQLQEKLESMVQERTAELEETNLKLVEEIRKREKYENALRSTTARITQEAQKRRLLSARLVDLLEKDRRSTAMALHDHLGQTLTTLKMDIERAEIQIGHGDTQEVLARARQKTMEALKFIRDISHTLRPTALESLGLIATLEALVAEVRHSSGLEITFFHRNVPQTIGKQRDLALYRIIQEAVINALKHGFPQHVFINMIRRNNIVSLTIEDDGKGFDQSAVEISTGGSLGIEIMKERAFDVGGELRIESYPGKGTQVIAEVPIDEISGQ